MTTKNSGQNPVIFATLVTGGRKELAESISPPVTRQAVERWIKRGVVPAERVPEVSRITGIPKKILNPLFS